MVLIVKIYYTKFPYLYSTKYDCNHTLKKRFTIPSYSQMQAMKFLIYIFLFAIMVRPVFPVLEYLINYDHIRKELCENRNKPQQDCNGKCHLKKELAKASENETPSSQEKKNQSVEIVVLFLENIEAFSFPEMIKPVLKVDTFYTNLYSHLDTVPVFHPPTSYSS